MKDRSQLREKFFRDDLPTRLSNLAVNLAHIATYTEDAQAQEVILQLLDESKLLIEWLAPSMELEQQFILVDLQRCLARWRFTWPQIVSDARQRSAMADQVRQWSDQISAMANLLGSSATYVSLKTRIQTTVMQTSEYSREEIIQQLVTAGLVRVPGSWDTPGARAWRERSEVERRRLINEMKAIYFPDSFASTLMGENRR